MRGVPTKRIEVAQCSRGWTLHARFRPQWTVEVNRFGQAASMMEREAPTVEPVSLWIMLSDSMTERSAKIRLPRG
jgi:hypothetical protein